MIRRMSAFRPAQNSVSRPTNSKALLSGTLTFFLSPARDARGTRLRYESFEALLSVPVAEKAAGIYRSPKRFSKPRGRVAALSPGLISAHAHPRKAPSVYSVAHDDILLGVIGAQLYMHRLFNLQFKSASFSAYDRSMT